MRLYLRPLIFDLRSTANHDSPYVEQKFFLATGYEGGLKVA
jgi:hypothetical protein